MLHPARQMRYHDLLSGLRAAVADGLVREQRDGDLSLFVYSEKCTYDRRWDDITTLARGLVLDTAAERVVATPWPKFWNYLERDQTFSDLPFKAFEKLDGCFPRGTTLDLWDGGTITINEVVDKKLSPKLIGMDDAGNLIPCFVTDWHHNGRKDNWLDIEIEGRKRRKGKYAKLRVTTNHSVLSDGRYKIAGELTLGDNLTSYQIKPDSAALKIIEASLLGDGSVSKEGVYQEGHTYKHIDYVQELRDSLNECVVKASDTFSGYGSKLAWVQSKRYEELKKLRDKWYIEGKKRVPDDLGWLDDFSVAKWYMDDGSLAHSDKQNDRAYFATNGFKQDDVQRLADKLSYMYGVNCTVYESKGWCIRVNSGKNENMRLMGMRGGSVWNNNPPINNFWSKIAPYIHPIMRYKLPEKWREVPYIKMNMCRELIETKEVTVVGIKNIESTKSNFPSGRTGYDITTTTKNYMCRGVLVHNSLIITFHDGQCWRCATKGSFRSEQAAAAQVMVDRFVGELIVGDTYLFELVGPSNKIVVPYERDELVLLSIYSKQGNELSYPLVQVFGLATGCRVAQRYDCASFLDLVERAAALPSSEEGFVVRFQDGLRLKIKGQEYLRIHKLISRCTPLAVWETMLAGDDLEEWRRQLPEEFWADFDDIVYALTSARNDLEARVVTVATEMTRLTDKELGLLLPTIDETVRGFLFTLRKHRDKLNGQLLKQLRPTGNVLPGYTASYAMHKIQNEEN